MIVPVLMTKVMYRTPKIRKICNLCMAGLSEKKNLRTFSKLHGKKNLTHKVKLMWYEKTKKCKRVANAL
jgi:hypothetical protein